MCLNKNEISSSFMQMTLTQSQAWSQSRIKFEFISELGALRTTFCSWYSFRHSNRMVYQRYPCQEASLLRGMLQQCNSEVKHYLSVTLEQPPELQVQHKWNVGIWPKYVYCISGF